MNRASETRSTPAQLYGSDWLAGSEIEFSGERFRIRRNKGDSGVVEYLDGTLASNNFYWVFEGECCQLISRPDEG